MRISPIKSSTNFLGRTTSYRTYVGKEDLKNNSFWHKNSGVEDSIGTYHNNLTGKVYFADPMEKVGDRIKESVDYVVYDNEPSYPDVNKEVGENYFGRLRKDFKQDFEEVRQYYYRREMGGFADVAEAKYQQAQAAHCSALYDKAGDLRYRKETAEDEIDKLSQQKQYVQEGLKSSKQELAKEEKLLAGIDTNIENLKKVQSKYVALGKSLQNGTQAEADLNSLAHKHFTQNEYEDSAYYNEGRAAYPYDKGPYNKYEEEVRPYNKVKKTSSKGFKFNEALLGVNNSIDKIKTTIAGLQESKKVTISTMDEIKSYIAQLNQKSKSIDLEIAGKQTMINDIKAKLIPLFDELKNFYATQGIKVIKKV